MAIKEKRLIWLAIYTISLVTGCAVSTDYSEGGNPMPNNWVRVPPVHLNQCASIDGEYRNLGKGRIKAEDSLAQTRLDVALGHTFPSSKMPDKVRISADNEAGTLTYQFGNPLNKSWSIQTRCQDGWYVSDKKSSDHYIGEGGTLDYSIRVIELGKSSDGSLIVHLTLESQSTSFLIFKARDTREVWSKFETIKNENQVDR